MKANERPNEYLRPNDDYEVFEAQVRRYFEVITTRDKHLYQVNAPGLWNIYLNNLPEDGRFVYDCRACKQFVERYGNLVVINEFGNVETAVWCTIDIPPYFDKAVTAMYEYVRHVAKVSNVFISDVQTLGTHKTGIWTHLHVDLPREMVNNSRVKNAGQLMAEKTEDFKMLLNALNEYPMNVAEQAVALLQTNTMYRSDRVLGIALWFLDVHKSLQGNMAAYQKTNLIWKAVGEAPTGYCHVKSSMIGTLLDDILAGKSTRVIMARFEEKMNPQNYMRSQSGPTAAAIEQAEKLVEKLGIADSLRRRYARFEEVENACFWVPKAVDTFEIKQKTASSGVFGHLTAKDRPVQNDISLELPVTTMTWDKFSRTILPGATKIEAKVENPNRFMALVTESVPGSENILQWDNPFSWYYHGGIDGEIKRRVEAAGGRYENCEIRCSLIWENYTDLDIHCYTPYGRSHIYYGNKRDWSGGFLDVDANAGGPDTNKPVEHIRWENNDPNGHSRFVVHNYRDRNCRSNPYKVELEVAGKIYTCEGFMAGTNEQHTVFEFDYHNGVVENLVCGGSASVTGSSMWGLTVGDFVEVRGILKSPNMWDEKSCNTNGNHTFFVLDGCRDETVGAGRGFFNEILKPELREIRKTLEAYAANTPIECADEADACGIGFSTDGVWDVTVKVTHESGAVRLIKIARFDSLILRKGENL